MRITNVVLAACIGLAGCSAIPPRVSHATLRAQIIGPKNDLGAPRSPNVRQTILIQSSGSETFNPPPGYAVVCNASRTSCKHAATQLTIHARLCRSVAAVCGAATWDYGRKVSYNDGKSQGSESVPEGVPVLGKGQVTKRFRLRIGQSKTVKGPFGARVSFEATD